MSHTSVEGEHTAMTAEPVAALHVLGRARIQQLAEAKHGDEHPGFANLPGAQIHPLDGIAGVFVGIIRILDLVFVMKDQDGTVRGMEVGDFDGDGLLDLAVFEGVSSGLLDEEDIAEASGVLEPGNSAGILVYENLWAAPFASATGARSAPSNRAQSGGSVRPSSVR